MPRTLNMESKLFASDYAREQNEPEATIKIEAGRSEPNIEIEDDGGDRISVTLSTFKWLTAEVAKYERLVAEAQKEDAA